MLEYCKFILEKVSNSKDLFKKELMKALNWIAPEEIQVLREWCYAHYGRIYPVILNEAFRAYQ